jgi:hypothetical protein
MTSTAVPTVEFTPTGLVLPTESAILSGVQADMNAAFGGNLNFGTATQPGGAPPQIQQAATTSAIIADNNSVFAEFVDQVDPDNATGFMQDAIGRIYFQKRNPGTPTTVQCVCVGDVGTQLPAGQAQARDTSGNIWICSQSGTIPAGGNITLPFACSVIGPIACPLNTVNDIYVQIPGWDSVNNPANGIVGSNVETPADFEFRRQNSVAANAHGSLPSIYGAVFEVAGVIDAYAYENVTDDTILVGSTNFPLLPHSMYIGVIGGASQDIANAIWTKKDVGCNMNGNTSVTVTDTSGYSYPQPTYTITYNNNAENPAIYNFVVNIQNSSSLPSTIVADVTNAINAQFNGVVGVPQSNGIIPSTTGQRVRIGSLLLASTFYGPVTTCEGPSVPVQTLSIFIGGTFTGLGTIVVSSDTLSMATVAGNPVSPGTVVTGTGIPAGTTIVQQLTGGIGGPGTYQMSAVATSSESGEAIAGTPGTAQLVGIDQAPQVGTVTVNLVG